jgi:EmrB/QacA subfamily drug resistance transporter
MTAPRTVSEGKAGSRRLALAAMLFAVAMTFIDQTIVAIASPTIQSQLALSRSATLWVVNAYLLALAAAFAFGGRLADVLGARRMAVVGIMGFAGASALCGATPKGSYAEAWLIVFRVLQGISGALMIPAALAVVVAAFPVRERGRALALFFAVSGGTTAIGPIAGGYLSQWTWRSIFWINIPIAVVALILMAAAHIPDVRRPDRIDVGGAVLTALGMGLSVLGFEQAQSWGWHSTATWGCIIGGLVLLAVFAVYETKVASPLIRIRIFRDRGFVVDNAVLFFSQTAFVPVFFFASVYAQVALGFNATKSGLYLLMIFAGFAPAAQIGGRMLDRGGARRPMVLGSALGGVGFVLWAGHLDKMSLGAQWPYIVMAGAGIGLLLGPASTDAVNRSIGASYGEVTGITQTVRNYGSALGMAVFGTILTTVLASRLTTSLTSLGVPAPEAASIAHASAYGAAPQTGSAPPAIRAHLNTVVAHDFTTATQWVLYGMAIALGITFLAALRHPARRDRPERREAVDAPRRHPQAAVDR